MEESAGQRRSDPGRDANHDERMWPTAPDLRALVDAAPDGLVIVDEQGAVRLINHSCEQLLGYSRAELIGQPVETLLPDRLAATHRAHRQEFVANPATRPMGSGLDLVARRADGIELPVEISLSPVTVDGQNWVMAAIRDISARMEAEATTRRLRRAIDTVADGVYLVDAATMRFVYANRGAATQTGYPVEALIGQLSPLDLAADDGGAELSAAFAALRDGAQKAVRLLTSWHRQAGEPIAVEAVIEYLDACPAAPSPQNPLVQDSPVHASPTRDVSSLFVLVVRDRSEQLAAEARFRATFENGPVPIALASTDGPTPRIVDLNHAAVALFGMARADLVGRSGADLLHPDDVPPVLALRRAIRSGQTKPFDHPVRVVRADGTVVWVDIHVSPLHDRTATADVGLLVVHLLDVSAEVKADEAQARDQALHEAVSDIRLASLEGLSRDEGLRMICRAAAEILDATTTAVLTPRDPDGNELTVEAAVNLPADIEQQLCLQTSGGLVGQLYQTGETLITGGDDPRVIDGNRPIVATRPDGSIIVAPLQGSNGIAGVLVVARRSSAADLDQADLQAITGFTHEAALAIELDAHRELRSHLQLLADRERIARDMHDMVIGRLFATGMQLQASLQIPNRELTNERVENAIHEIDLAIDEIRSSILGLRTDPHGDESVRGTILAVVAHYVPGLGFEPTVELDGPDRRAGPRGDRGADGDPTGGADQCDQARRSQPRPHHDSRHRRSGPHGDR